MLDLDRDLQASEIQVREALQVLKEAKKSGGSIILTINGQASINIEGERAFQMLFELATWVDSIAELRQSLKDLEEGKGVSLEDIREEFLRENAKKN